MHTSGMHTSSPAAQGVDAEGIIAFVDALDADPRIEPHGLIVQRHGHRIAEGYWAPHAPGTARLVYSLSKSFTGAALGLQLGEGRLTLDDLVSDHLPELFDDATPDATRRMRIRHIASMSTGHAVETLMAALIADPTDPVRGFLTVPPDAEPGTVFAYNQPPVLTLARILERLAGEPLVDYLRPRLLDPLGIDRFGWRRLPSGDTLGFSGVYTDLDAIARLGQLHLDGGTWRGRRLLPDGWVAEASSVQTPNGDWDQVDWQQGYGFQFWMSRHGYRGDGAAGQFMVILPEHDAVVAMFSCEEDMQAVLDLMWTHLLPAFGDRPAGDDDAEGASAADEALARRLAGMALPTAAQRLGGAPVGEVAPTTFERGRPCHQTITRIEAAGAAIVLHEETSEDAGALTVPLTEAWTPVDDLAAASATRLADGTVAVDLVFVATPHRLEIVLDPASSRFVARWPLMPLFGAGLDANLTSMRAPTA